MKGEPHDKAEYSAPEIYELGDAAALTLGNKDTNLDGVGGTQTKDPPNQPPPQRPRAKRP